MSGAAGGGTSGGTVLVIGRSGQVASELARAVWPAGLEVCCRGRESFDLADAAGTSALVREHRPALIVNAAAYTAVDRAETESAAAYALNRDGPAALAVAAAALGVPLIHLSTDYVFDGTKSSPYLEDDPIAPLGVYGASKAAGEQAVRERCPAHVILRTAWVYSPFGANFVRTMLRLGGERPEVGVVADQVGCPTAAAGIAAAIVPIAGRLAGAGAAPGDPRFGTFHLCGAGATSWHGFAAAIFEQAAALGAPMPRLKAITTADYPTPARRPARSVLATGRIGEVYGVALRPWPEALGECLRELLSPRSGPAQPAKGAS